MYGKGCRAVAKQLIVKELAVAKKWAEEKVEQELEKACA